MEIERVYIRELPQKQYHLCPYNSRINIPKKHKVSAGDMYIDYHEYYVIDKVVENKNNTVRLYCTVYHNDIFCENPYYKKKK